MRTLERFTWQSISINFDHLSISWSHYSSAMILNEYFTATVHSRVETFQAFNWIAKQFSLVLSTDTSHNFDGVDEKIGGRKPVFFSNWMKVDPRRILKDIESVSERPCRKSMEHMNDPELLLRHNSQPILWSKNHTYFGITKEADENSQTKSDQENHLITFFFSKLRK